MAEARLLTLENKLGQRVRTFHVSSNVIHFVFRKDSRRLEATANLKELEDQKIAFLHVKSVSVSDLSLLGETLGDYGRVKLAGNGKTVPSPTYELLEEEDRKDMLSYLKKSSLAHAAMVVILIGTSFLMTYLTQKEEQQLVTIVVPETKTKQATVTPTVKPAKVTPKKTTAKVTQKLFQPKHPAKVTRKDPRALPTVTERRVVHSQQPRNLQKIGALAALGGLKNGTKGAQGLDLNSLKQIRSAGTGQGGGGIGRTGSGGMTGVLPVTGLIAGSKGNGGRAESAGGYGTKGVGGGKAGYGKISLVGNVAGISLPLEEEATVVGGLDEDQIKAVIARNQGQITYCYEQGLQARPELNGIVTIDFVIGPAGRIAKVGISQSSLESKAVETCIVSKMRNWQFPRPVGSVNVDVQYPFQLRRVSKR